MPTKNLPYPLTIAAAAMRAINRSAILEIIRLESPISRTAIAERLEVSLPTVMRIVDELIEDGFVRPQGSSEWTGSRRRSLLEFNADGHVVLGVDMGGTKMYGALSDLGGNVIDELDIGAHGTQGEAGFETLVRLIDTLLASPKLDGRLIRGIGIGAPGITLHQEGIVKWIHSLQWSDFPLRARLAERYPLPITVENDVNLAALGELWFGAGQNCRNLIVIAIGTGIGAGIIIDRALYRGSNEASGELGNILPGREFLGKNYLDFGALESVASGTGIVERAQSALHGQSSRVYSANLSVEDVLAAASQGEAWVGELVEETIDYLAVAIANLSAVFDPDLIVLGGGISHLTDLLVEPIHRRIQNSMPYLPRLESSKLGPRACVMGAITQVLHNTDNFYVVHKLS